MADTGAVLAYPIVIKELHEVHAVPNSGGEKVTISVINCQMLYSINCNNEALSETKRTANLIWPFRDFEYYICYQTEFCSLKALLCDIKYKIKLYLHQYRFCS
jgi:hypothetical protein